MSKAAVWGRSIGIGTLAAVGYGVVHDQISIRISPPYLLDWHPSLLPTRDPTTVALVWGVVATWWFGLILGAVLAGASTLGPRPQAPWAWIVRATAAVFATSAVAATLALLVFAALRIELPNLFGEVYAALDPVGRLAFSRTAAMHEASYDAAGVATVVAAVTIYVRRGRILVGPLSPEEAA